MASTLAGRFLQAHKIDVVLCFSPSVIVATDFQSALEQQIQLPMDGRLGSKGQSLTYQSMTHQDDKFWSLFDRFRVLAIFDEIHHCAGDSAENANAWGHQIIQRIQGRATYTLALTGTPWRSDRIPISLASYAHDDKVHCDFVYGLRSAVSDAVCRAPAITLVDNDRISIHHGGEDKEFRCFADLLKHTDCSYRQLINNEVLITYLLEQSAKKLRALRKHHSNAGGLIVAATVEHAYKIADILERRVGEQAVIATYMGDAPQAAIAAFREGTEPWIISVGMVSEGTNIPRLRVCCHLTRVKTELHFRQVLGRILRMDGINTGDGYLYIPAEPSLAEYAGRVIEEIPDVGSLRRDLMPSALTAHEVTQERPTEPITIDVSTLRLDFVEIPAASVTEDTARPASQGSLLAQSYEANLNMFGRFRQELLTLHQLCA